MKLLSATSVKQDCFEFRGMHVYVMPCLQFGDGGANVGRRLKLLLYSSSAITDLVYLKERFLVSTMTASNSAQI